MPISMKAGRPARFDYEYERNGTANLFMMFAPLEGWRHVKVTDRHDPPPLKWSDLRYVFDIKEDCNGKEAIQA